MLKQRVVTAMLALPAFFSLFYFAPAWVLMVFFTALVGLGTYEMAAMLTPRLESIFNDQGGASKKPLKLGATIDVEAVR